MLDLAAGRQLPLHPFCTEQNDRQKREVKDPLSEKWARDGHKECEDEQDQCEYAEHGATQLKRRALLFTLYHLDLPAQVFDHFVKLSEPRFKLAEPRANLEAIRSGQALDWRLTGTFVNTPFDVSASLDFSEPAAAAGALLSRLIQR